LYDQLLERTQEAGLRQYEIANFARETSAAPSNFSAGAETQSQPDSMLDPAYACQHNLNYWRGGDFFGLGPSATSYLEGIRTKNWSNTQIYCEQVEQGRRPIESSEELTSLARAGETAAFELRTVAGCSFEQFERTTGHDLRQHWGPEMAELQQRGWGRLLSNRFHLTREGLRFADAAAELFLR